MLSFLYFQVCDKLDRHPAGPVRASQPHHSVWQVCAVLPGTSPLQPQNHHSHTRKQHGAGENTQRLTYTPQSLNPFVTYLYIMSAHCYSTRYWISMLYSWPLSKDRSVTMCCSIRCYILCVLVYQTLCSLLDCLLTEDNTPADSPRELYEIYFVFACVWAFGGALFQDHVCGD